MTMSGRGWWVGAALAGGALLGAGCGGDGHVDGPGKSTSGDEARADTTTTLDTSPFCVTIRSLEALGSEPSAAGAGPSEVLTQNASVASLLDDAAASAPDDAPADVQALFDDYRLVTDAIVATSGDTSAAYEALNRDHPGLLDRLGQPDAHREAFAFFADRCGTAPPPAKG
jgi:hypothetical protein